MCLEVFPKISMCVFRILSSYDAARAKSASERQGDHNHCWLWMPGTHLHRVPSLYHGLCLLLCTVYHGDLGRVPASVAVALFPGMALDAQPLPADIGGGELDPHRGVACLGSVGGALLLLGACLETGSSFAVRNQQCNMWFPF